MSPFFVTMVYALRKRKVEQSLRGTQDYVYGLSIRNPIREVRIAEPL